MSRTNPDHQPEQPASDGDPVSAAFAGSSPGDSDLLSGWARLHETVGRSTAYVASLEKLREQALREGDHEKARALEEISAGLTRSIRDALTDDDPAHS
jgi:hypothetical protein